MDALGTETYELLRDAYQVIDGIPDERVNLKTWQAGIFPRAAQTAECGTIACAGGFLALHPDFRQLGLEPRKGSGSPTYANHEGFAALSILFGITYKEASNLFGARLSTPMDMRTDREVWLARVRKFLAAKAAPDNMYWVQA